MRRSLRLCLMLLGPATLGLVAQSPAGSSPGNATPRVVEVASHTAAPRVALREALALAEKKVSPATHYAALADLRIVGKRPSWALWFNTHQATDDGAVWVTVDMERRVAVHGTALNTGPAPTLDELPVASSSQAETISALPVDWKALSRFKGPEILRHEGRIFVLDLRGWEWMLVCDGPHAGPDGNHVVGTYAKPLPGMNGDMRLTIWLLPEPRDGALLDHLSGPGKRTEPRVITMGGLPGTLHLTRFERGGTGGAKPPAWYASAEQAGPGWHLWLEVEGDLEEPNALVQEVSRLAASLRRLVGMPSR